MQKRPDGSSVHHEATTQLVGVSCLGGGKGSALFLVLFLSLVLFAILFFLCSGGRREGILGRGKEKGGFGREAEAEEGCRKGTDKAGKRLAQVLGTTM